MRNIAAGTQSNFVLHNTHPAHLAGKREKVMQVQSGADDFRTKLVNGLESVNTDQIFHENLAVQAIADPESVDAHDLTIASAKAAASLSITKNIVDRVIQAYRDITNLR